ncbi:MAG: hypothetical protein R3211_01660 [Balneolaceae bacterium]|nr:hypothetical protein [Balneolaceae bacterium]
MNGEEFVLALVAMVFGSVVAIVVIAKITGLIKSWMNRNKNTYSDEEFEKLARAFVHHKKEITERIQNLEAIVTDESKEPSKKLKENRKSIEIESGDSREEEQQKSSRGNLRNMLKD